MLVWQILSKSLTKDLTCEPNVVSFLSAKIFAQINNQMDTFNGLHMERTILTWGKNKD